MSNINFRNQDLNELNCGFSADELKYKIVSIKDARLFMEKQIFVIWDYMSLIKGIENKLRDQNLPWFPSYNGKGLKVLNAIIDEEEYILDAKGDVKSCFEMYLEAMEEIGANTSDILNVLSHSKSINLINEALGLSGTNIESEHYTRFIYNTIKSGKPYLMATVYAISKEIIADVVELEEFCIKKASKKYPRLENLINHVKRTKKSSSKAFELASILIGDDPQKLMEAKRTAITCFRYKTLFKEGLNMVIMKQKVVFK